MCIQGANKKKSHFLFYWGWSLSSGVHHFQTCVQHPPAILLFSPPQHGTTSTQGHRQLLTCVLGIWTQFLRLLLQVFLITHWAIFLAFKNLLSCINSVISFWQSLLVRMNGLTCERIYQDANRDRWFNKRVGVLSIIRHPFITIVY